MPDLKSLFKDDALTRTGIVESVEAGNICKVRVGKNILKIRSENANLRVGQSVVITESNNRKYIIAADKNQQRLYKEIYING